MSSVKEKKTIKFVVVCRRQGQAKIVLKPLAKLYRETLIGLKMYSSIRLHTIYINLISHTLANSAIAHLEKQFHFKSEHMFQ